MTRKICFIIFILIISLASRAENIKAAAYNNKIIDIQHALTPKIIDFLKNFETRETFESISSEDLKNQKASLIKDFDKAIKKVAAIKEFEGDGKLRDAALKWFVLYKETLNKEYDLLIENLSKKDRTEEEKLAAKKIIDEMHSREEEIDRQFEEAQVEFAKRHKLEIKNYPLEK